MNGNNIYAYIDFKSGGKKRETSIKTKRPADKLPFLVD
jgi:hypothetical protein